MKLITNNPWITVIILLLLTANIATLGYLWMHKNLPGSENRLPTPPPPQGQVFEFVTKELQLDSAQQIAYKVLREEHQKGQGPLQDGIRKAKDDFFTLLQQPAASDSLIQILSSRVAAGEQQLEIFNFKHFQKLRAICNAGQQNKFDLIIKDVLHRMAPGKRPPGPPPGGKQNKMPAPGEGDWPPPPPGNGNGDGPEGRRLPPPPGRDN